MNGVFFSTSEEQTTALGEQLGGVLKAGDAVLFEGEMGAGKTYFTKGIAKALGIADEITSPTFAVVNEYSGDLQLFHFDLFRIPSYDDLYAIGFFDYPERGGVMVIEWSENLSELQDEFSSYYIVRIEKSDGDNRRITVLPNGGS